MSNRRVYRSLIVISTLLLGAALSACGSRSASYKPEQAPKARSPHGVEVSLTKVTQKKDKLLAIIAIENRGTEDARISYADIGTYRDVVAHIGGQSVNGRISANEQNHSYSGPMSGLRAIRDINQSGMNGHLDLAAGSGKTIEVGFPIESEKTTTPWTIDVTVEAPSNAWKDKVTLTPTFKD